MPTSLILDYQRYYPDNTLGLETLSGLDNVLIKELNSLADDLATDEFLHEALFAIHATADIDRIFIPASMGPTFTDFLGLRLACHIRFTESLGKKRMLPIILYSSATVETMFYRSELTSILRTKGTYLIGLEKEEFLQYIGKSLEKIDSLMELQAVARSVQVEAPKSYHDAHSIANVWGAYQLDKAAGTNILDNHTNPTFINLYFKWLKHNQPKLER